MSTTRPTDSITDFGQFNALRRGARENDDATVRKAAQQFEALLTQQMLKSARASSLGDDVMGGGQTGFYQDIFDQQMAVHLSSGKGLGLADLLVRQLRGNAAGGADTAAGAAATAGSGAAMPLARTTAPLNLRLSPTPIDTGADAASSATIGTAGSAGVSGSGTHATSGDARADFVQKILPHAERAARELGVPARVLIAQAALETGWGQHAIRHRDGQTSLNYFGIKADHRWSGDAVRTTTTEYVNGSAQRERADFRAYDSAAASFDDYVRFLKSNPRYASALDHGGSATRFVQGLQKAGYATDPAYAQKIMRIANGPTMQLALAGAPRTVMA